MKFLFASDSFKGSLPYNEIHQILATCAKAVFPSCETIALATADGGEGTTQAIFETVGGTWIPLQVRNPLFENVPTRYLKLSPTKAVMEMASASGLTLIGTDRLNPERASTFGTGELILHAIQNGVRSVNIGIGGSATNDGGTGAMAALGFRFLDANGIPLIPNGANLAKIRSIDASLVDPRIFDTEFVVMSDVDNPLLGPDGATYTFSEQKGADSAMQERLEMGMRNFQKVVKETFGLRRGADFAGAGAAGGLGYALKVFLKAKIHSGIETVLHLVDFDRKLNGVDYVITGEGRIDWQSAHGKVITGILMHANRKGIPVIALVGCKGKGFETLLTMGLKSIISISEDVPDIEYAMTHAKVLYGKKARSLFESLRNPNVASASMTTNNG